MEIFRMLGHDEVIQEGDEVYDFFRDNWVEVTGFTGSTPREFAYGDFRRLNVGEEYRRVEDGEFIQRGDERYSTSYMKWVSADDFAGRAVEKNTYIFRRRRDHDEYRPLVEGDVISEGDEYFCSYYAKWVKYNKHLIGLRLKKCDFGGTIKRRRPIRRNSNQTKKYRLLDVGEIIQENDEYFSTSANTWIYTQNAGQAVCPSNGLNRYRRLIESDSMCDIEKERDHWMKHGPKLLKALQDISTVASDVNAKLKAGYISKIVNDAKYGV